jgi:hypothetical protein
MVLGETTERFGFSRFMESCSFHSTWRLHHFYCHRVFIVALKILSKDEHVTCLHHLSTTPSNGGRQSFPWPISYAQLMDGEGLAFVIQLEAALPQSVLCRL